MQRTRIWSISVALALSAATAACASPDAHPESSAGASAPASASVEPSSGSGSPPVVTVDKVTVTVSADRYAVGENLLVSITNRLDRSIYTEDFKTECTIVYLQRKDNGAWMDITGCRLGRPTMTVAIGAGASKALTIDPNSFHLTGGSEPGLVAGSYRVKFTYRFAQEVGGDDPFAVYSAEFTIG
jgi:hypothetical protein